MRNSVSKETLLYSNYAVNICSVYIKNKLHRLLGYNRRRSSDAIAVDKKRWLICYDPKQGISNYLGE
jgi:hypothetical protein